MDGEEAADREPEGTEQEQGYESDEEGRVHKVVPIPPRPRDRGGAPVGARWSGPRRGPGAPPFPSRRAGCSRRALGQS